MEHDQSEKELLRRLSSGDQKLSDLLPADGIDTMLRFYSEQRVEKCEIEDDGDMLLYQCGVYGFGDDQQKTFQISITRQFILSDEDEPYQLALIFHFEAESNLRNLGEEQQWCNSPEALDEFEAVIKSTPTYLAVGNRKPMLAEVMYGGC